MWDENAGLALLGKGVNHNLLHMERRESTVKGESGECGIAQDSEYKSTTDSNNLIILWLNGGWQNIYIFCTKV